jgi:hypothetical protein
VGFSSEENYNVTNRGRVAIPVMRRDHPTLSWRIIASDPHAKAAPPMPDPAALIPLARLRFVESHWEKIATLGT